MSISGGPEPVLLDCARLYATFSFVLRFMSCHRFFYPPLRVDDNKLIVFRMANQIEFISEIVDVLPCNMFNFIVTSCTNRSISSSLNVSLCFLFPVGRSMIDTCGPFFAVFEAR